jgi:hypothetical protein
MEAFRPAMFAISEQIVDSIKQALRVEGITYAHLAQRLALSETAVKRMFSKRNFPLQRLDAICDACQLDLPSLLQHCRPEANLKDQLSIKHERMLVEDNVLLLVTLCAMNHMTAGQIAGTYRLDDAEVLRCLVRLDRMGVLALHPGNRIRVLVSRTFRWTPGGPIERFFRTQIGDFFQADFVRESEMLSLTNVMLSEASRALLLRRMKALVDEFVEAHCRDSRIDFEARHATSVLMAARHWELPFMRELRR